MRVLVIKDGTVPVVVAKVLATDEGATPWSEYAGIPSLVEHDIAEFFEVEDDAEALDVTWADSDGFSVYATTIEEWFKDRQADDCGGTIETVDGRQGHLHFVQSDVCHGEDERWYSHLFVMP